MDTQQRYALQMQARYQRYLQKEQENEDRILQHVVEEKKEKEKRRLRRKNIAPLSAEDADESAHLVMDRHVPAKFRILNIIIDSDHRNIAQYPDSNNFVVKLQENLVNIAAIRVLKTEFYQPSTSFGYFVLNEMKVPLQLYNVEHAYLYLNGYINTAVANDMNVALFGRIGPGTDIYPAITADPYKDPYIYVMRPVEPKMRRFHVKLLKADGSAYPVNNARVVLTLAVYCFMS
jgi:hypothetical protein